jgi:nucleoside-diphosphate kinase
MKDNAFVEQTVVLIKPDGVKRGLVGEILSRFERAGLKIVSMKMVWVEEDFVGKHYRDDNDYHRSVGEKTLENYKKYGADPNESLGTTDPVEIGRKVRRMNMDSLTAGPLMAILLEGWNAVEIVRKMVGHTFPQVANPGTIRGDFSIDSAMVANLAKRATQNLVHASGNHQEAEFERKLWFKEKDIYKYRLVGEVQ